MTNAELLKLMDDSIAKELDDAEYPYTELVRNALIHDRRYMQDELAEMVNEDVTAATLTLIDELKHRAMIPDHYPADREFVTELALRLSLCPHHLHDYAICFDDSNPECAMIRHIHPGHDS